MLVFVIVFGDYVTPALVGGFSGTMVGSDRAAGLRWSKRLAVRCCAGDHRCGVTLVVLGLLSLLLRKRYVLEGETS